jgi:hypothetical protein
VHTGFSVGTAARSWRVGYLPSFVWSQFTPVTQGRVGCFKICRDTAC